MPRGHKGPKKSDSPKPISARNFSCVPSIVCSEFFTRKGTTATGDDLLCTAHHTNCSKLPKLASSSQNKPKFFHLWARGVFLFFGWNNTWVLDHILYSSYTFALNWNLVFISMENFRIISYLHQSGLLDASSPTFIVWCCVLFLP